MIIETDYFNIYEDAEAFNNIQKDILEIKEHSLSQQYLSSSQSISPFPISQSPIIIIDEKFPQKREIEQEIISDRK